MQNSSSASLLIVVPFHPKHTLFSRHRTDAGIQDVLFQAHGHVLSQEQPVHCFPITTVLGV